MTKNKFFRLFDEASFNIVHDIVDARLVDKDSYLGDAGTILSKELEYIIHRIHEQVFPELTFLKTGIGVDNSGGYSNPITSKKIAINGGFKKAGDSGSNDGRITLSGKNSSIVSELYQTRFSETDHEVGRQAVAGINLLTELIKGANLEYNKMIDEFGYVGNGTNKGILNTTLFATDGASATFATLTPKQIVGEIFALVNAQRGAVNFDPVFSANKIIIPSTMVGIFSQNYNENDGILPIHQAIKQLLNIDIVPTFRATTTITAISTDSRAMEMRIPMPLKASNEFRQGFRTQMEFAAIVAGVDIYESDAGFRMTGVA